MKYRLAIFDFDGTLADSFPFFIRVFNQLAEQHGRHLAVRFHRVDHLIHRPDGADGSLAPIRPFCVRAATSHVAPLGSTLVRPLGCVRSVAGARGGCDTRIVRCTKRRQEPRGDVMDAMYTDSYEVDHLTSCGCDDSGVTFDPSGKEEQ